MYCDRPKNGLGIGQILRHKRCESPAPTIHIVMLDIIVQDERCENNLGITRCVVCRSFSPDNTLCSGLAIFSRDRARVWRQDGARAADPYGMHLD